MKMPGKAVLEFRVEQLSESRSRLVTDVRFHPAGTLGLLYWYALVPLHPRIFAGMTSAIVHRAEERARVAPNERESRLSET